MENYAKRLAVEHNVQGKINKKNYPIRSLKDDFEVIRKAYEVLSESVSLDVPLPPSGEWILDNFYVIEEQVNVIQKEFKRKEFMKLPAVKGKARIQILAEVIVELTDGNITKEGIEKFILAYQSKRKMAMEEIWMFPVMLKMALLHHICLVCERMISSQCQKFKVASLVERIIENRTLRQQVFSSYRTIQLNGEISSYIEFLVFLLKKEGKTANQYLKILNEEIQKAGTTVDEIIKTEHYDMALQRVSMSNSITSMKNILRYNWSDIFEQINGIEKILLQDEWYQKSDNDTKTLYRNAIQKISKKSKYSETYIAIEVMRLAHEEEKHIGEYLLGEEQDTFWNELGFTRRKKRNNREKLFLYLFSTYGISLVLSIWWMKEWFWLGVIPISEGIILIVNKMIAKTKAPTILPRLESVPKGVNTFVIVPTLVNCPEKVKEIMHHLEIFYLSNRMDNLYFALLGDCSEEEKEEMEFDEAVIQTGKEEATRLNEKYGSSHFFFLYRKRVYNVSQEKWLGYERKRGMITEFVNFLIEKKPGTFCVNTIETIPEIKYIITLDCDTILPFNTAQKLIGTLEHPLNQPKVEGKIVTKGYGLIQPKVGILMKSATASIFARMMAGDGGIDAYSTAESNVYQDVFGEGIFTGKGIFHVTLFHDLLKEEIPPDTVLSHDLLEGSYLRCGLASDIEVMDGFPAKVNSYFTRLHRWTRGDWQIISWLWKKGLNGLSKYKIWDNLRRSIVSLFLLGLFFSHYAWVGLGVIFAPFLIDVIETFINDRIGIKTKNYLPIFSGLTGSFLRALFSLLVLPYQAYLMGKAIAVTVYRMVISRKHLLEWMTASDAETTLGNRFKNYLRGMWIVPVMAIVYFIAEHSVFNMIHLERLYVLHIVRLYGTIILWLLAPYVSYRISQPSVAHQEPLTSNEREELKKVAQDTWHYFLETMNDENHFLPPDNYQLGRKNRFVPITSATNIGLGLLAILSAYDMTFITKEEAIKKLKASLDTIIQLEKWKGHLYNWYHIQSLKPLTPLFVSTVDSGNFVGYLYVIENFLKEYEEWKYQKMVRKLINETDFSQLYDFEKNLFSIGYDVRESRLVDSYYDLLASEARLGSFVAIAKHDIPYKHWFNMSRTLTTVDHHKGLVSWSGTMFEYFMPFVVMPSIPYTLLDETYFFCIESQKKYARKLNIPWGISESAFNLQDLNNHYQYKAFGIPWLGLKRGLKEEVVVSPYSSFLALPKIPKTTWNNIQGLKELGAYDQYGFYDAIDFTPNRVSLKGYRVVKTNMAHHQALILLSINNYFHQQILQQRFMANEEIQSVSLLLEERIPQNVIFTKTKKEKVKVLKYKNYEDHVEEVIHKPCGNVSIQSNNHYTLLINDKGEGYATFNGLFLTKYHENKQQGVCFYIKNLENGKVISNTPFPMFHEEDDYEIKLSPSCVTFYRKGEWADVTTKIAVSPEDNIELRAITIQNKTMQELSLAMISYLEPVLAEMHQDIAHPAYQNLFLRAKQFENSVILEKKCHQESVYYCHFMVSPGESNWEFELDKAKLLGRLHSLQNPSIAQTEVAYSNEATVTTCTAISFQKKIKIPAHEQKTFYFYCAVGFSEQEMVEMVQKYQLEESANRLFDLAYSKSIIENRFLGYRGKDVLLFHRLYSFLRNNDTRKKYQTMIQQNQLQQQDLWRFGISGDNSILLVKINRVNDIYVIKDLLSAIEYFHQKNILVDLVILNEEESKYEQYVQDKLYETISNKGLSHLLHQNGGVFIIKKNDISWEEECLLLSCSDMILQARDGFLREQLIEMKGEKEP